MDNSHKVITVILVILSLISAYLLYINWDVIKLKYREPKKTAKYQHNTSSKIYTKKYILVDSNKNQISPDFYDSYSKSFDNRIVVKINNKYGVIDYKGIFIIPIQFRRIQEDWNAAKYIAETDNKNSASNGYEKILFDINGKKRLTAEDFYFQRGYTIAVNGEKHTIYNKDLEKIKEIQSLSRIFINRDGTVNINSRYVNEKQYITLKPPVTRYPSDFKSKKLKGYFPKLTCDKRVKTNFCSLSPNGLSAKLNGRGNYYLVDEFKTKGKYYFEFQVDTPEKSADYSTKFAMIDIKNSAWKDEYNIHEYGINISKNDIICVALDYDNRKVYITKNGEWMDRNNPADKEKGEIMYGMKYENHPAFSVAGYKEELTVNFGMLPFKYDIPKGYAPYYIKEKGLKN